MQTTKGGAMRAKTTPAGISAQEHQALGRTLQRLRAEALAVRQKIREGHGAGTIEYQTSTALVSTIKRLTQVMMLSAAGAHAGAVGMATLRTWYDVDQEPFDRENGQ